VLEAVGQVEVVLGAEQVEEGRAALDDAPEHHPRGQPAHREQWLVHDVDRDHLLVRLLLLPLPQNLHSLQARDAAARLQATRASSSLR